MALQRLITAQNQKTKLQQKIDASRDNITIAQAREMNDQRIRAKEQVVFEAYVQARRESIERNQKEESELNNTMRLESSNLCKNTNPSSQNTSNSILPNFMYNFFS